MPRIHIESSCEKSIRSQGATCHTEKVLQTLYQPLLCTIRLSRANGKTDKKST
jgi:hypothetical protein